MSNSNIVVSGNPLAITSVQIDWQDLIDVPVSIQNAYNCLTCDEISSLSGTCQSLSNSIININNDIIGVNAQLSTVLLQQADKVSLNTFNKHHHDCRYYTKNQLKFPNLGAEVNWFNITSLTPAMSAVYYSGINSNQLLGITTPLHPSITPSSNNPFVTYQDLVNEISASAGSITKVAVNEPAIASASSIAFSTRLTQNIYDIYYSSINVPTTRDFSSLKYHTEYLVHRRNPLYANASNDSQKNWIDEDIDGNKVWIGERQIFTGGKDGVVFQSGSFVSGRATSADSSVVGLPNISDLYNNVVHLSNQDREKEFADRQVIVYGGVEIGRNLTLLTPISGTQFISASGADTFFKNTNVLGNINFGGYLNNTDGKFNISSVDGSITSTGHISIDDYLSLRNYVQIFNSSGTQGIFRVDASTISGTQQTINISNLSFNNGDLTISGTYNGDEIDITNDGNFGGNGTFGGTGTFGGKISVGGISAVSTFLSSISSDGKGFFFNGLTNANTNGYCGFFGGNVLISGGLTIADYFRIGKDLIIDGSLTVNKNVNLCVDKGGALVVGQTDTSKNTGSTYVINWSTHNNTEKSTVKLFTREFVSSANLFTLRASDNNVISSGNTVGPYNITQNQGQTTFIDNANTWNGVDIRTNTSPYAAYTNNFAWSGLEIKTYLNQVDSSYKDSQYFLWTSNQYAYSKQVFPGVGGSNSTENFPNTSDNFGWIMSDWFRTAAEETNGVKFPLHLVASKDYVDYRMAQLNVAGGAFKIAPENISKGLSNPDLNDVLYWNGTGFSAGKINLSSLLWDVQFIGINASNVFNMPMPSVNTVYILTSEGMDGNLTINLPQQQASDVKKEIVIKFLDVNYYPATINAYSADTIDGNTTYNVSVPMSAIRLFIPRQNSWVIV